MRLFVFGFITGLLAAMPVFVFLLRRNVSRNNKKSSERCGQLEELSRLTGELAHEIKNPLSTIKVNLKLIGEELEESRADSADGQRFGRLLRKMGVIQKEADRVEQILTSFLRYVGKTELQPAKVDINEIVSDMIDFYSPQAHTHSMTVRQWLFSEPLFCNADAGMLKQVILNLFVNAQQAMSGGGELMIKTAKDKQTAVIQISDTGSGIASERLSYIFEPYQSFKPAGSGLGLATAKKIIDAHRGTINVDSTPGKGTLFTIKLPLQAEG